MRSGSFEDYIQHRISKAEEIFLDAKLLAENQRWRSCVNRLYYSTYYLLSALLYLDGISTKSHNGLKIKFFQLYIKTGTINSEFGKLYSQLLDWRQESDYADFVDFSEEDVLPVVKTVSELNSLLRKIIDEKKSS